MQEGGECLGPLVCGEGVADALEDALEIDDAALGDLHGLASLDLFSSRPSVGHLRTVGFDYKRPYQPA